MTGNAAPVELLPGEDPHVLVEGGHYALGSGGPRGRDNGDEDDGEVVCLPDGRRWRALTTSSTRLCFAAAVTEALALRGRGVRAVIGLLVGDLALPPPVRPVAGAWALPPSYLGILADASVDPAEVKVYGEAYARNQGKRRLLDEVLARKPAPEETYRREGWALFRGGNEVCLASDASLDWDGDVRVAMLTRGPAPLCPLVFAGLKRAVFQSGFCAHWMLYSVADDNFIDRKLRAAAAAVAQLRGGRIGAQRDLLFLASGTRPAVDRSWERGELIAPGERSWPRFVDDVREHHPQLLPLSTK